MWRKRIVKCLLGISAAALLLAPGTARAQVFFGFPFGGYGGGGLWGYNYPGLLYARPVYPNMMRGAFPGFNTPYLGGYGGGNPYAYNPLMNASFMPYYGGGGNSIVLSLPGFASTGELARKRPTTYPALAVSPASSAIRQAAYSSSDDRARIEVIVPANAEVKLQGVVMSQTGTTREFVSPPLERNSKYSYDVRVRWHDSKGKERTATERVRVWAGATRRVDFTGKQ